MSIDEIFEVKLDDKQKGYLWAKLSPKSKKLILANYTPTKEVEKLVLEARKQELQDAFREMNKGLFRERLVYYDARMNTLNTKKEG